MCMIGCGGGAPENNSAWGLLGLKPSLPFTPSAAAVRKRCSSHTLTFPTFRALALGSFPAPNALSFPSPPFISPPCLAKSDECLNRHLRSHCLREAFWHLPLLLVSVRRVWWEGPIPASFASLLLFTSVRSTSKDES